MVERLKNADNLDCWERRLRRWSTLPSLLPNAVFVLEEWEISTKRILRLLAAKVAECRLNPESMPSERLLGELKQAMQRNDELWHSGAFYREDDPAWYAVCHEKHGVDLESDDFEELDDSDRPVVSTVGQGISLAVRRELDRWERTRMQLKADSDLIIDEIKGSGR
jgi:hypothetical protein